MMKYKTLTKGGSTYYRKLKILIPIKGKYEKDFLNTIFQILLSNIMKMRIRNMSFRNYIYLLSYVVLLFQFFSLL